jgi:Dynamin-like GTPase OPA1 C-terminal
VNYHSALLGLSVTSVLYCPIRLINGVWFAIARRLERNIKDVLDQIGDDKLRLQKLLTGKRVLLAEELSK